MPLHPPISLLRNLVLLYSISLPISLLPAAHGLSSDYGQEKLSLAIQRGNSLAIKKLFITGNADVNEPHNGITPLMQATYYQKKSATETTPLKDRWNPKQIMLFLLTQKADVNGQVCDSAGTVHTPLSHALTIPTGPNTKAALFLFARGALVNGIDTFNAIVNAEKKLIRSTTHAQMSTQKKTSTKADIKQIRLCAIQKLQELPNAIYTQLLFKAALDTAIVQNAPHYVCALVALGTNVSEERHIHNRTPSSNLTLAIKDDILHKRARPLTHAIITGLKKQIPLLPAIEQATKIMEIVNAPSHLPTGYDESLPVLRLLAQFTTLDRTLTALREMP